MRLLCHDDLVVRMRRETRLLLSASLCGAAVGIYAALRMSTATPTHSLVRGSMPVPSNGPAHESDSTSPLAVVQQTAADAARDEIPSGDASQPDAAKVSASESLQAAPSQALSPADDVPTAPQTQAQTQTVLALALVAWTPADDWAKSEHLCTVGEPIECLRLAESLATHAKTRLDSTKAQAYRERAYAMLVLRCHQRSPDACVTIARMHALGFGLPKNQSSVNALVGRARDLCKHKTGTVCSAFGP